MNQLKLIEKIHAEFDTAQERLLNEAKAILSNQSQTLVSIADRLKNVGFVNTPTAKKGTEAKQLLVESTEQAKIIEHYKFTYPFLKFLTESELDRICKKYDLVYASVDRYIKEVPEKNLRDIEIAQPLHADDKTIQQFYFRITRFWLDDDGLKNFLNGRDIPLDSTDFTDYGTTTEYSVKNAIYRMGYTGKLGLFIYHSGEIIKVHKKGLFIAAPASHFNLDGLTKKGEHGFFTVFKTEIKDPIVFRYVRGGIQVLTKWGLEANDPALVVPVLN